MSGFIKTKKKTKTMEKLEKEVFNYLLKVSKHIYKSDDKWMKLFVDGEKVTILRKSWYKNYTLETLDFKSIVNRYKENAKCVISHNLFLTPRNYKIKYSSVKQNKWSDKEINDILESIK